MATSYLTKMKCFFVLAFFVSYISSSNATTDAFCDTPISSYPYLEGFNGSLGLWTQSNTDDYNWVLDNNGTPSSGTGPTAPYEGSHYLYVEASGSHYPYKEFDLISPCFAVPADKTITVNFAYHMYGGKMGSLDLKVSTDGTNWTSIWYLAGNQGNAWKRTIVPLIGYEGQNVQLMFSAVTGENSGGWQSDVTIDDLIIQPSDICYAVGEDNNGYLHSWLGTSNSDIGTLNEDGIEAMTLNHDGTFLYTMSGNYLGTINVNTGNHNDLGAIGSGDGAFGTILLNNVDGLTLNPTNGLLMAVQRRNSLNDLLFAINPITQLVEKNYFGQGVDYMELTGALQDVDDLAFHPTTKVLYAISGISSSNSAADQIVTIDQYTGIATQISVLPTCDIEGLTFDNHGNLYGSTGKHSDCSGADDNTVYLIDYSTSSGKVYELNTLSTNDVEALSCFVQGTPPCLPVDVAGVINGEQIVCYGSDVGVLGNTTSASTSVSGTIEYQWFQSTTSCVAPLDQDANWIPISGATAETYNPGVITEATCFARGARIQSCPIFYKFSNVIQVTLTSVTVSASADETNCLDAVFSISGSAPGSGETGIWTVVSGSAVSQDDFTNPSMTVSIPEGVTVMRWTVSQGGCDGWEDVVLTNTSSNCSAECVDPLNVNGDLEQEGLATNFNLSLQSTPALLIEGETNPVGWAERYGSATNTSTFQGAYYLNKTGSQGDPHSGSHYIYIKGSSFCLSPLVVSTGVSCGKTYEMSVWIAAYSYSGVQTNAPFKLEFAADTDKSTPVRYATEVALMAPASNSWNDLNWQRYVFSVTIPDEGYDWADFYFTSDSDDHGILVDDLCIKEINAGSDAKAGVDIANCVNSFSLSGNTPEIGYTGSWSVVNGNVNIATPSSPTSTASFSSGNTASLRWMITDGSCTSSDTVVITYADATGITANDESMCLGQSVVLTVAGCTGDVLWSTGETTTSITVSPVANTDYTVSCTSNLSANAITNPGFESSTNFQGWTNWANSSVTTDLNHVHSGTKAVVADATSNWAGFGQSMNISPGEYFEFNFWAKSTNTNTAPEFGYRFYDASWNLLLDFSMINITSTEYEFYSMSGVAPQNAAHIDIGGGTGAKGKLYMDDFSLTKGNGCTKTAVSTVTLTGPDLVASSPTDMCLGVFGVLNGSSSENIVSWSWTGPNGFTSSEQNPMFPLTSAAQSGVYTLIGVDDSGCSSLATTTLNVDMDCSGICSAYVQVKPTNPTTCAATDGYITMTDGAAAGVYENSMDGINWNPHNHVYTNLGIGTYTVFTRDASSQIVCRSVNIRLVSNNNSWYTGENIVGSTGCSIKDGSIELQGVLPTDDVCWIYNKIPVWVNVGSLSPANTITDLSSGKYYVKVRRNGDPYCYNEREVNVPNNGEICPDLEPCVSGSESQNLFPNGDFGVGAPKNGDPLPFGEIDYGYVLMNCAAPNDGFYSVVNHTDCDGNGGQVFGTFDVLLEDHTPSDSGGYMLLVNASFNPDVVIQKTITGLLENTYYNFSAYVYNIVPQEVLKPNLTFLIDGVGLYSTGTILESGWKLIGFQFYTGNKTTMDFAIRNNQVGGSGNDWLLDDIKVSLCEPIVTLETETDVCAQDGQFIEAIIDDPGEQFNMYQWQLYNPNNTTWEDVGGLQTGTYSNLQMTATLALPSPVTMDMSGNVYRIKITNHPNNLNQIGSNFVVEQKTITVIPAPVVDAGLDQSICDGSSVSISATATGNGPLTYTWDQGLGTQKTQTFTPVGNTSANVNQDYITIVTDVNGCTDTDTVNVEVLTNPAPFITLVNDNCEQGIGSITFTYGNHPDRTNIEFSIDGGASWVNKSDNSVSHTFNNLSAGTYDVKTRWGNNECEVDITSAVITTDPIPTVNITGSSSLCLGENTTLTPSTGGTWISSNPSVATISNNGTVISVSPGKAAFTFTNTSTGCISNVSDSITVHPSLTVGIGHSGGLCLEDDSELTANVLGGTAIFSYSWTGPNGFSSSSDRVNIIENGNYYLTVTDAFGCTANTSAYIYQKYEPILFTLSTGICEGEQVTFNVNSASAVSYQWGANAGNDTTSSVTVTPVVPSSTYFVTVTNDIGCSTTASATIAVDPKPIVSITGNTVLCVDELSSLSPSTGGTWSSSNPAVAVVSNSGIVTSISGGSAIFTFTDTTSNCISNPTTAITVIDKPIVAITGPSIICEDGISALSPTTGGTWESSDTTIAKVTNQGIVTGISTGTVTFRFTNTTTGCFSDETTTMVVNSKPIVQITGQDSICTGATTTLTPTTGGTWTSSDESIATITNNGVVTGVFGGTVTFTFQNTTTGCISDQSAVLTVVNIGNLNISGDSIICKDESITLSVAQLGGAWVSSNPLVASINNNGEMTGLSSGTTTITYIHNSTTCYNDPTLNVQVDPRPTVSITGSSNICTGGTTTLFPTTGGIWTSSNISIATVTNSGVITGVSGGNVSFIYTSDTTGCSSVSTNTITVFPAISVAIDFNGSVCLEDDSQLTANVTGGTPTFSYNWSGPNGFSSNLPTISIVDNGNYYVTVTDGAGCSANISAFVYERFEPFIFTLNTTICEGNDIDLSVNSSTAVNYQWSSNAGSSTSQSINVIPSPPSTTYYVTITNDKGCSTVANAVITVDVKPIVSISGPTSICQGETTTLNPITGGTWTSSNNSIATVNNNGVVTALEGGVVSFLFTETSTGCVSDYTNNITITSNEQIVISGDSYICLGDSINLTSSNSNGTWVSSNPAVASISSTGVAVSLSEGTTNISFVPTGVTCYEGPSFPVQVYYNPNVNILGPTVICEGSTSLISPTTGGVWTSENDAIATITNAGLITGISSGEVYFTFTSYDGCSVQSGRKIKVVGKVNVALTGPDELCIGEASSLTPSSGGLWTSSNASVASVSSSGNITALSGGVTTLTFTEWTNGCVSDETFSITVYDEPIVSITGSDQLCIGNQTILSPSTGGVWISSDTLVATVANNGTVTAVSPGVVSFTFENSISGCVSDATNPITVYSKPAATILGANGICVGSITTLSPSIGGTWSSSNPSIATVSNVGVVTGISAGSAKFIFTNTSTGCNSEYSDSITVTDLPTVTVAGSIEICIGEVTTLSSSTSGTWTSSNNEIATVDNNGNVTGVNPGNVTFILTSSNSNCDSEMSQPITVKASPTVNFDGSSAICIGSTTSLVGNSNGTWISSDESVATIDVNGVVTGLSVGSTIITFTDDTGCQKDADLPVTVFSKPDVSVTGLNTICIGTNTTLSPSSGGTWLSSDLSVASVTSTGVVTGLSAGNVTFTFLETGSGCYSDPTNTITVINNIVIAITGPNTICEEETTSISPTSGGTWSSNNESVATITNDGTITGHSQGIVRFTFTADSGCSSEESSPVLVFGKPSIVIDGPSTMCIGSNLNMSPSTGGTWISSDETVATIDNSGIITALKEGIVRVQFTDSNTGCVSELSDEIIINGAPTVSIGGSTEICIGESTNLTPTVGGVWTSVDPTVASVENNGTVVGVSAGNVKFIFTELSTGCLSDSTSIVTVLAGVTPSYAGPEVLCIGDTSYILPNTGGTWISTDTDVASISNSGQIIGLSQGSARFVFVNATTGCISSESGSLTVNGIPNIGNSGSSEICIGSTTNLFPTTGGIWTSSNNAIATVSNSGIVTGVGNGSASFTFESNTTGCITSGSLSVSVADLTNISITGDSEICIGYTTTLSPTSGGVWLSNNPQIATVSNTGVVTGVAPGKVAFQFIDSGSGCTSSNYSDEITIEPCINNDFNVTTIYLEISGDLSTNDNVPANTTYSNNSQVVSKPSGSAPILTINPDGTYTFESSVAGKYIFDVPVCIDPLTSGCPTAILELTVVEDIYADKNPISNLEFVTTFTGVDEFTVGIPIEINSLANDRCLNTGGCDLEPSLVTITKGATNGTQTIDNQGKITYTPEAGFIGYDTITYQICVNGEATNCSTTDQIITVSARNANNSVVAVDDFEYLMKGKTISGNVLLNDSDPESNALSVVAIGTSSAPISVNGGSYYIDNLGAFTFKGNNDFTGYTEVIYTVCDDQVVPACKDATIHLLVFPDLTLEIKVYLQGALQYNGGVVSTITGKPLMRDDLRINPYNSNNYIVLDDPYSTASGLIDIPSKYNHVGSGLLNENKIISDSIQVFNKIGDDAIVDWVFVELRSKSDNTLTLATRSGLVQRDGDVVDLDGISPLSFGGINQDSFYVVVNHRSHLAAMTELVSNTSTIDFTDPETPLFNFGTSKNNGLDYTGLSQATNVADGYSALWAGDFDSDGKVKFANPNDDQNVLFFEILLFPTTEALSANFDFAYEYIQGDFNMNGKAKFTNPDDDTNLLFSQVLFYPLNTEFLSNFDGFIQQVPK